ncbi:MAG: Uma2 family endonuclease [Saprospiraceae bacterium]|nr:Uma2 family endonuclease [Saprospiraceae bacterium]MCF8252067.1 Uma2 family endonuclease [Saprospiraceae bacterium]MCF8281773.1 Uma2 family endonuclease [Bacteroidales bacterium]MCF8313710.1 Uma2 family endonuclease [Saprospiraceae bacterium]MCF8442417.1 Uma2 family endonuclease [Saprospiraceae bacterium]
MSAATLQRRKDLTFEEMVLNYGPIELQSPLSKEEFMALAERHPDFRMERETDGYVTIMSPVKRGSSKREFNLSGHFFMWHYQTKLGELHGSSGTFDLPDGAIKMPDVAWISPERLAASNDNDEEKFVQIVPDFVAEVRSGTDRLAKLQRKMKNTWMKNGVRLAWLIDPYEEKVHIYRTGQPEPEIITGFSGEKLSGEAIMPGFELPLDDMKRQK